MRKGKGLRLMHTVIFYFLPIIGFSLYFVIFKSLMKLAVYIVFERIGNEFVSQLPSFEFPCFN